MKKIFIILFCGVLILLGGCSKSEKKSTSILLSQKQLSEAKQLSGMWIYNTKDISENFRVEITKKMISVEKSHQGSNVKEEFKIYDFQNEEGQLSIYGSNDENNIHLIKKSFDTAYIGGGKVNFEGESAWQIELKKK